MKRKSLICFLALTAMICISSVGLAAEVSQGKCTVYDAEKKLVTIDEYNLKFSKEKPYGEPTGVISVFDLNAAVIGIVPEPGDILRIAYTVNGTQKNAVKIMNVSKQDLRKK